MLDNNTIGIRLKQARLATGLNKSQFATAAGIDISQYGKAERGIEGLGKENLRKIAEAHHLNLEFFSSERAEMLAVQSNGGKQEDKEKPGSTDYQAEFKDAMKTIRGYNDFLQEIFKSSLGKLLEGQVGTSALVGILLRRDIDREAGGNLEKEKEILDKILQKIGPKLNSELKDGIGADGHR